MRLRAYLTLLVMATLLPVGMVAGIIGHLLVREQRETFRRGAEERTLALLTAVDAELRRSVDVIHALSHIESLSQGDMARFRRTARRVLRSHPGWNTVNVALPSGERLMDMLVPEGAPLPPIPRSEASFQRALETRKPVIGDLALGPTSKRWDYAVRVPVSKDGEVKYVLSAVIEPASISSLVAAQHLPHGWVGVVLDGKNRIVARTVDAEKSRGRLASQSLRAALGEAPSGWFRGSTIEGTAVYTPYRRSPSTGWVFAMGIPAREVDAVPRRAYSMLLLSLLGAIGLASWLALVVGRRISGPIAALASATNAIGRGERVPVPQAASIAEVRSFARILQVCLDAMREREERLQLAQAELRKADRAKDEFLAMLSHELRNPLAALTSAAHVLKVVEPSDADAAQARGVVERQTKHMAHLVGDLLDISRVTLGRLELKRERFDAADVVSGVVNAWRASGRGGGHEVSLSAEPVWVAADRARVEQIVVNLFENALKFTPPGKRIELDLRREGGQAVLRVADQGIGLTAEERDRVFDLFAQGDQPERAGGGLGIGLALVKRLAEMHGGTVSASSEGRGRGAVFEVRLPAAEDAPAEPRPAPSSGQARARSVLIVEDNDDARRMLEAALKRAGHRVHAARDGAGGLALAAEVSPEVALVDIALPGMDGYEVARRLRTASGPRGITLIAVTGFGQLDDQRRAAAAGFDVHLVKPVTPERLQEVISALP